ncbi:hypothetical protein C5746_39735 [Streptomyces atratus]|uniref:Uncharacterized protein n=1 Tax=Streptomyces atratus TaxID=1893 RepID=A0A2Z5JP46_STRAR|nr:hypothetical protein C5746_39735 [Streptomyces atratus]
MRIFQESHQGTTRRQAVVVLAHVITTPRTSWRAGHGDAGGELVTFPLDFRRLGGLDLARRRQFRNVGSTNGMPQLSPVDGGCGSALQLRWC